MLASNASHTLGYCFSLHFSKVMCILKPLPRLLQVDFDRIVMAVLCVVHAPTPIHKKNLYYVEGILKGV